MSGALETAAAAFAVVGVADVVVRTGRELYNFLCDVSGAPNELKRLNECIREIVMLAKALNKRAPQLSIDADIVASVQGAIKALDRELQSIKLRLAKFKGAKTTWTKIKYTLDDRKIAKALANLEQAQSLLTNSLALVYGESSAQNFDHISTLVAQVDAKTDALTQTITSSINTHLHNIKSGLDTLEQQSSDRHNTHQQALQSQLDVHHQQHSAIAAENQRRISKLDSIQSRSSNRQEKLIQISKKTNRSAVQLHGTVQKANCRSMQNHQKTRIVIEQGFKDIQNMLSKGQAPAKRTCNEVYFWGERSDMLITHLLPIEDELNVILKQIWSQNQNEISNQELSFLGEQFSRLVASAAQEQAARYHMSTATSFDEWVYPGQGNTSGISTAKSQQGSPQGGLFDSDSKIQGSQRLRKRPKRRVQALYFETRSGTLQLRLPQDCHQTQNDYELGLSFANCAHSSIFIDIRFIKSLHLRMHSQICTHLNVFTRIDDEYMRLHYSDIIRGSSIQVIDMAIREGIISPYHLHHKYCLSPILYQAAYRGRVDVLQYLESQGIGITGLRQYTSIEYALYDNQMSEDEEHHKDFIASFRYTRNLLYDPTETMARLIMEILFSFCEETLEAKENRNTMLSQCLNAFYEEGGFSTNATLCEIPNTNDLPWNRQTLYEMLSFLTEASVYSLEFYLFNLLSRHSNSLIESESRAFQDFLYVLVKAGVNVNALDADQRTPSIYARSYGCWPAWCQVLQESGGNIAEVLRAEGNDWLLAKGWKSFLCTPPICPNPYDPWWIEPESEDEGDEKDIGTEEHDGGDNDEYDNDSENHKDSTEEAQATTSNL